MAIIYADQVSELAIRATYAGREHVNVLHYVNDETALSDAAKAKDILDNWQDHIMEFLDSDYSLSEADWRSLDRDDRNQGTVVPDATKRVAGGVAGQGLPPNCTWLVKKITNDRGRGQRDGRMFISGVPGANVFDTGVIAPAWVTNMQTAVDAFLDGVNDDGFGVGGGSGLVVLNTTPASREKGTMEVDLTFRTVGSLVVDSKIATQRDRLR